MAGALTAMIAAAFAGGVTPDPYFEYTTLLLPGSGTNGAQNNTFLDGSTNNFTITRNGNTTQGTFSPFSQTGWGGYFNGSDAGVYATVSAAGTGAFTWEAFVFVNSYPGSGNKTIFRTDNGSGALDFSLLMNTSGQLLCYDNPGTLIASSTTALTKSTWVHVAVVRDGSNNVSLWIGGSSSRTGGTGTLSTNLTYTRLSIGCQTTAGTETIDAYISNARYCKSAVYTSSFIPATSTLTPSSQGATNCQLLTLQNNRWLDNSGNSYTVSTRGSPTVVAFSPFNPTASWSAATYGGSGYFDGSGDNLKVSNNAAFQFGTTAFTIEFWAYLTTTSGSPQFICCYQNSSTGYNITLDASAVLTANLSGDGADITGTTTVQANQWNHIALSGTGGTSVKLFLNGVQEGSTFTGATSLSPGTYPFTIGSFAGGGFGDAAFITGYMSNVRVVKGTAVYTSNFTPPTAPLTAITNTSLLLNFTNAGIYDATSKNDLETVGNAQISNTTAKFGSTSIYMGGSGNYLIASRTASPLFRLGTGDFTIEGWFYLAVDASTDVMFDFRGGVATAPAIFLYTSNQLAWFYNGSILYQPSSLTFTSGQWNHVALVRASSVVKFYLNGTGASTTYTDTNNYPVAPCIIGTDALAGGSNYWNGYIQDTRITLGVARYTTNFTPGPAAAFPTL